MTKQYTTDIPCPKCGQKNETQIFSTLNVSLNPEGKKQLLECKLNRYKCGHCGLDASLGQRLLYNDMTNKFCAYYMPLQDVDNNLKMFNEKGEMLIPYRPRIFGGLF